MIDVHEEHRVDYELTAQLATDAFASDSVQFKPDRLQWLYESSFGHGSTVLSAFDGERKVGQVALLNQQLCMNGEILPAVQLVDLFIIQSHRSAQLVSKLYKQVEQLCRARDIRYILALPNQKSEQLNERLIKVRQVLALRFRAGGAWPVTSRSLRYSGSFKALSATEAMRLVEEFETDASGCSPHWNAATLISRLGDPSRDYGLHVAEDLLLVSARRVFRDIPCVLLCGFLSRKGRSVSPRECTMLVRAAAAYWRTPLFVYAGVNATLPALPGIELPARLRRPITVQLRDLANDAAPGTFDTFQLIDSDFA